MIHFLKLADVSTRHITQADSERLKEIPGFLAETEDLSRTFYYVPTNTEMFLTFQKLWEEEGMSEAFLDLMNRLHIAGAEYVYFTPDADPMSDLPVFDW